MLEVVGSCCKPTALHIGLYQGFLKEIRKKVRKLLYHSLRTNVANLLLMDTMHHVLTAWCIVLWVQV